MKTRNLPWEWALGALLGIGLGLLIAWGIAPVRYTDTPPSALRPDHRASLRLVIAAAYQSTGDLPRARARLAALGDADPVNTLTEQARLLLEAGGDFEDARTLALLASAIQQQDLYGAALTPGPSPTLDLAPAATPPPEIPPTPAVSPTPWVPPTARPTHTATATPGQPYALTDQQTVCQASGPSALLMVSVRDAAGRQVPGVPVTILWGESEETFFTGLKPEIGNGYADFSMTPGVTYQLQVGLGGATLGGLEAPSCPLPGGGSYIGSLRLTFRQP